MQVLYSTPEQEMEPMVGPIWKHPYVYRYMDVYLLHSLVHMRSLNGSVVHAHTAQGHGHDWPSLWMMQAASHTPNTPKTKYVIFISVKFKEEGITWYQASLWVMQAASHTPNTPNAKYVIFKSVKYKE